MRFVARRAAFCALALAAVAVSAQEPANDSAARAQRDLETWVAPVVADRRPPEYPPVAAQEGREGWVALSYIVTKEGAVTDAMIEDSSGNADIERAALAAIRKWRYTPGTRNGEPVDHPMIRTIIRFQLDGSERGTSRDFLRKYKEITAIANAGDAAKAQELLEELAAGERHNLYEDAWFWWLRYTVLTAAKSTDTDELMTCLTRAVTEYLPPDLFVAATVRLFLLRVQTNDLGGALTTFQQLKDSKWAKGSKDYQRTVSLMDTNVQKIHEFIASPATLANEGRVGSHEYWVHSLVRRSFAVGDVRGDLDALEIRCLRHNVRYEPVTDQHTWTVPASWEKCGVYMRGKPGATFKFYEYPDSG